jgi:hypothetical protein
MSTFERRPQASPENSTLQTVVEISAAQIVSTAAGNLGHTAGVPLVPDPGAGKMIELVSLVFKYTRLTASYTGGGNITVNTRGGTALTGVISAANSLLNAASRLYLMVPLAASGTLFVENRGLNLVSSAAFTNSGSAAGTLKIIVNYRIINL